MPRFAESTPKRCAVAALALAGVVTLRAAPAGRAEGPATVPSPATRPVAGAAVGFGPIGYYQANCLRCHGPYGSYYGPGFAADLSDAELAETVAAMCEGPAQAPLDGDDLAAEVAYHRSLARPDGPPFVAVTSRGPGGIAGEVTPGSTFRVGDRPAVVEGHGWRLDEPDLNPVAPVVAERGDHVTTLAAGDAHSHACRP